MIIGGTSYKVRPWPASQTTPAITWKKVGDKYHVGRDRGAAQDVYEGKILVADIKANLDSLQSVLNANREGITLSGINSGECVFGADVDYSGAIDAAVVDFGFRRNIMQDSVYDLEVTFRALSPSLLGTTPSLTSLRLQEGWEGDRTAEINTQFSYDQVASYADHASDVGTFTAAFRQSHEEMKAIRAYLLTTARANPITFPDLFSGIRPFGPLEAEGQFQKCHVIGWTDARANLNRWDLRITFAQAEPYFSAGGEDDDDDTDAALMTPSDTEDYYATPGG